MYSKAHLYNEAERLYVHELKTVAETAKKVNVSVLTISKWKEKGEWELKRKDYLKSKQAFHQELYEFARKLMKDISTDMDNGEKVDPGRMYAFCKVIPMFVKVKEYEEAAGKKDEKQEHRGLTPELIRDIEEKVLGITYNDEQ